MNNRSISIRFLLSLVTVLSIQALTAAPAVATGGRANYQYELSNFNGTVPFDWVKVHVSPELHETYVFNSSERSARIFNESGMEVYEIVFDEDMGIILDVVPNREGDIFLLLQDPTRKKSYLARCDYRGELRAKAEITGLPVDLWNKFNPSEMACREDRFYLLDRFSMVVVVTDASGTCKDVYDLGQLLALNARSISNSGISGFSVDRQGNLFFTIQTHFQAFKVSPDRKVSSFGQKGSAPGKFNIVGGIVADERGYCYVADTLRSVVMVFDKDFRFQFEFGYEGDTPGNLAFPKDLDVGPGGMVYVSQAGSRGVSVFRVTLN